MTKKEWYAVPLESVHQVLPMQRDGKGKVPGVHTRTL